MTYELMGKIFAFLLYSWSISGLGALLCAIFTPRAAGLEGIVTMMWGASIGLMLGFVSGIYVIWL